VPDLTARPGLAIDAAMPKFFTGGFAQTNGYVHELADGSVILIDAPAGIDKWLKDKNIHPTALLLTHQHYDHVESTAALAALGIPVYAWEDYSTDLTLESMMRSYGLPIRVEPYAVNHLLKGLTELDLGGEKIHLSHVPGHATDSVTFYFPRTGELFSGDTLFQGGIGRTDLPGGSHEQLLSGIRTHLLSLPGDTITYPGHGPSTTIQREARSNPYLA
jgi:hydroxyacylglutathione hydrolase